MIFCPLVLAYLPVLFCRFFGRGRRFGPRVGRAPASAAAFDVREVAARCRPLPRTG